jgi:hypothetical protein
LRDEEVWLQIVCAILLREEETTLSDVCRKADAAVDEFKSRFRPKCLAPKEKENSSV